MKSIRGTLLAWLLAGLALVALLATAATYLESRHQVDEIFDLQLKQLAYSTRIDDLVRGRTPNLSPPGTRAPSDVAEIVTQIWDRDGVLVYYSQPGMGLPVPATEGYTNVTQNGHEWRIYTLVDGRHALQVAHAMSDRRRIAGEAALRTLLPLLALTPFLAVFIWFAVGRGLRPLDAMSRAVGKRRADAMSPLSEAHLPSELLPLAGSLNALLARLDEALSAQRRFTADAAHELRTPLAALKLQADLVQRATDETSRTAALGELQQGIARATHLTEQLLTMARLEPEAMARNFADCDLEAIAKEAIVARAVIAADRKIDLGLVREAPAIVRGDAASLAMLVANLLDNALRYTPPNGRIDVAVDASAQGPTLWVRDTGPGIPAAERARVLDRFHRGPTGPDDQAAIGAGLGLSIVKRITDAHGAILTLDGDDREPGLIVSVQFPGGTPAASDPQ